MENTSFKSLGISEDILEALLKLGYKNPSEVQQKVIPIAIKNKDIIVKSKTGSGKTAAFGIPICENIDLEEKKPQALILTPTRELCVQVKEDIKNIGRFKRIKCSAIFGKQPFKAQALELKQRTHVVVGTPGRTMDHIERGTIDLDKIKYFIVDEGDEMFNMGFIDQVESIMRKLPKKRVNMLFSATIPEKIEKLCEKYMKFPVMIEVNPEEITEEKIEHIYYEVEEKNKFELLNKILITENPDSAIIFCRTQENVNSVAKLMKNKKYPCKALHGGMMQDKRIDIMERFKKGEFMFLVATDLAARGIDVENVTHIINYDIPMEKENYVHRTGRTGRAGRQGRAISLVTPYEDRFFEQIEEYIGFKIKLGDEITKESVENAEEAFIEKIKAMPKIKKQKSDELNKGITKIYLSAGKKKKIRPGDIVGGITSIAGVNPEDVGIIDIQEVCSYVDILNGKGKLVLEGLKSTTIKGKKLRAERAVK